MNDEKTYIIISKIIDECVVELNNSQFKMKYISARDPVLERDYKTIRLLVFITRKLLVTCQFKRALRYVMVLVKYKELFVSKVESKSVTEWNSKI